MSDKPRTRAPITDAINHALGVGRTERPEFSYDEEQPLDLHDTHDFRGMSCCVCGTMDYWPGASLPCGTKRKPKQGIPIHQFPSMMAVVLDGFVKWWESKGFTPEDDAPTFDEWLANLIEYRKQKKK